MSHFVYILYSVSLDKYYIGSTSDKLEERIRKHNSNHSGFTGKSNDWKLVYKESLSDKLMAMKREREIKAWKSRKRVENLISSSD